MAELINKNLLMEELHSIFEGDADLRKDYEYMGIDDFIRSMPTTTEAEIRAKAIEEFAKALKERCKRNFMAFDYQSVSVWEINRIAEELKKNSNETQIEMKGE